VRSLRNFQSQCFKIASEGLLYPDNQASRISVCCCFCSAERYSHSRTEVRRIHVIDGHRSSKRALCCVGGTEVGAGLLNVIVSRHGIQSRARGDKKRIGDETGDEKRRGFGVVCGDEKPTVVRRPGMHKEMCSLLAGMKRSQRNHAVPGNTELAGHGSCSGSRGRPARRHARKLKRGGRGHCTAVRVQCTDTIGQAGVRANRENAQTTGQKTSRVARKAEASRGALQRVQPVVMTTPGFGMRTGTRRRTGLRR
jgi:hypothetical protein